MKKISVITTIIFLALFTIGCNTIAGTAKGVVDDVKSIIPGI